MLNYVVRRVLATIPVMAVVALYAVNVVLTTIGVKFGTSAVK